MKLAVKIYAGKGCLFPVVQQIFPEAHPFDIDRVATPFYRHGFYVTRFQAWRQAVEHWLVCNGHIRIHKPTNKNQKTLPYYPNSLAQN